MRWFVRCFSLMLALSLVEPTTAQVGLADPPQPQSKSTDSKRTDSKRTDSKPASKADEAKNDAVKNGVAKPGAAKKSATEKSTTSEAARKTKSLTAKHQVVKFTLDGDYPEGPGGAGVFADIRPSLATIVQRIDAAASDEDVRAVWLKIEDLRIGRGKINELRGAIARVRKAGKPAFAEITTADTSHYLLASACDKIVMPPSGMLLVPGVRAEVTFFKGLLDKLGLQFDALQMGKYKGAAEPLTRNEMSPPLRESYEALVDDTYQQLISTFASERKLQDYQVKTCLDRGMFTANDAVKARLIDEILYSDQLQDAIRKHLNVESIELVTDYKKKKIDADFSGFSGMMKLMELMMGGKPSEKVSKKQKVAVVYAVGAINEGKSESSAFGSATMGSSTIVAALRKAAEDPKVVAVVLRIDSPGGSATASDLIWRETVRMPKPLIASMSDVAGSGGYYIAMGAKKIYAAPGTLTGSIGVIGGKLVTRGLYDKLGMKTDVISRGANSGALSSQAPFTADERKVWTELLQDTYQQFVGKAAEGRKMPYSKLEELAQGRVYTGRMAKNLGLVDELGTLQDAIAAAKTAAGLKADADVETMVLPEPKTFFEQLFSDPSASTDLESVLPEGFALLRQSQLLRQLLSQKVLMWMPYGVTIR